MRATAASASLQATAAVAMPYDVAYADTDAGGIVYHARYVEMAERSRNRAMVALGVPVQAMRARFGVLPLVREVRATYHRPAFVGDALSLASGIVAASQVRAIWGTRIDRAGDRICDVEVQLVAFDPASGGPCLLPAALLALLEQAPRMAPARRTTMMKAER